MNKPVRMNAFVMNTVAHQSPGLWRHPRDQSHRYNQLNHWISIAKTLERGLFDGMFLADVFGVYDVYGGNADAALNGAVLLPIGDPPRDRNRNDRGQRMVERIQDGCGFGAQDPGILHGPLEVNVREFNDYLSRKLEPQHAV